MLDSIDGSFILHSIKNPLNYLFPSLILDFDIYILEDYTPEFMDSRGILSIRPTGNNINGYIGMEIFFYSQNHIDRYRGEFDID